MIKRIGLSVVVICAEVALLCTPSFADTFFDLTDGTSAISEFAGPYATVDVNLTSSTTATITFTSLTNSGNIYLMGDGGAAAVNVDAPSFTTSYITGSNAGTGFTPGPFYTSSGTEDGFGNFNLQIDDFDGFGHSVDTLGFTLTNNTGTWASSSDVLTPNSFGSFAAGHIFVTNLPARESNVTGVVTGFSANFADVSTSVPEPSSLMLLVSGLVALFGKKALHRA